MSQLVQAIANENEGVSLLFIKNSDIRGKFAGQAEQNIINSFEAAMQLQPCILFFGML